MDMDDDDEMDGDGGFEAELAMLDEVEADMRSIGEGPEAVSTSTRWSRPPVPSFDVATDALVFQQFDIDCHTGMVLWPVTFLFLWLPSLHIETTL